MTDEHSPILDFYPLKFSIDLNGKRQEWEAVVLIPFIDEERLLQAMECKKSKLTAEEVQRNVTGSTLIMKFDNEMKPYNYPSSLVGKFPDIMKCQTRCEELTADHYSNSDINVTTKDGIDASSPEWIPHGFPTFRHIPFKVYFEQCGVRVFQVASRTYNMCLTLAQPSNDQPPTLKSIAENLIGRTCYVDWPFLVEAMVVSVADLTGKITSARSPIKVQQHNEKEGKAWQEMCTTISHEFSNRRGINIGDITMLVEAKKLVGSRCVSIKSGPKGVLHLEKQWSSSSTFHPYQTIVMGIGASEDQSTPQVTLESMYSKGTQCVLLSSQYYGSLAEVISVDMGIDRVHVRVRSHTDIDFSSIYGNQSLTDYYYTSQEVCNKLHLSNLLLSRISSSCSCEQSGNGRRREIGLCFKYSKRQLELPGYCKQYDNIWMYSKQALDILKAYVKKFPIMFQHLNAKPGENIFSEDDLFPSDSGEKLSDVEAWLKTLPTYGLQPIKCGSFSLDTPQVAAVERLVAQQQKNITKTLKLKVKPWTLFKPSLVRCDMPVDKDAGHELLDRVMNVSLYHPMRFGLTGTITGIRPNGDGSDYQYEIVFDEAFTGGHTWRCGAGKGYCLSTSSFVNISHGNRLEERKKGGRLSLPANFMPQGTTYSTDQVDYRYYSPRANSKTVQKLEKFPKQSHTKKPAKQSYDKVEVRLLKRPTDNKNDKVTSPASKTLNHDSSIVTIATSPVTIAKSNQQVVTATPTTNTSNLTPSVAAIFAAAAAVDASNQVNTTPPKAPATPTYRPAPPTCRPAPPPAGGFSSPLQAILSGMNQSPPPASWRPGYYTPPRNYTPPHTFPPMPPPGLPSNFWSPPPPLFNPGPRHPNGPQVNPIAELQHVASIYGYQPVKVYTHRDSQGLYTGVAELSGLGMYRGTPSTDDYMAKCSAAAVVMAMLRQPLLPGPVGFPTGTPPHLQPYPQQYLQPHPHMQQPPVGSVQPSFIPLQVQKKSRIHEGHGQSQERTPQQNLIMSLNHAESHDPKVASCDKDVIANPPELNSNTSSSTAVKEPLPSQVAN